MAQALHHIQRYLQNRYPRPTVDPEWLQGCYQWLMDQPNADPHSNQFLQDVEAQLLQSDLTDSMLEGTGLPIHITQSDHKEANTRLTGPPVLVEIVAITEIASSAYQLDQIRVAREERMRLGQTDDDEGGEGDLEIEGEGPMPKYPRGMLRLQLSDGATTLSAIEYRSLPDLVLGKTKLGFKMLLKNPMMRHGIAFLEPNTVTLIGYQTDDREAHQPIDFARGLRVRMGLPIEPVNADGNAPQPQAQPAVAPIAPPVRSPLREISPPPGPPLFPTYNDDENLEPRRRKLPSTSPSTVVPTQASSVSSTTLVPSTTTSRYFSNLGTSSNHAAEMNGFNLGLTTAQASQAPVRDRGDDDDGEDLFDHFDNIDFFEENNAIEVDENAPPSAQPKQPTSSASSLPSISYTTAHETASTPTTTNNRASHLSSVQENSLEIVSFTLSQGTSKSLIQGEAQNNNNKGKDKGKGKERQASSQSPTNANITTTATLIDASTDLELDPDLLAYLDEIEAAHLSDPDFLRKQEEEMARIAQTRASVSPTASTSLGKRKGKAKTKDERPIKPLPKSRRSLSSQPQPQSPRLHQSQVTTGRDKEVIEIDDSSSSESSPKIARSKPLFLDDDDDDIEVFEPEDDRDDDHGSGDEEEEDKENMPVMTRHVRRKVVNSEGGSLVGELFGRSQSAGASTGGSGRSQRKGGIASDVIELSDED